MLLFCIIFIGVCVCYYTIPNKEEMSRSYKNYNQRRRKSSVTTTALSVLLMTLFVCHRNLVPCTQSRIHSSGSRFLCLTSTHARCVASQAHARLREHVFCPRKRGHRVSNATGLFCRSRKRKSHRRKLRGFLRCMSAAFSPSGTVPSSFARVSSSASPSGSKVMSAWRRMRAPSCCARRAHN